MESRQSKGGEAATRPTRTLREIAREIRASWENVHYTALPYLEAMEALDSCFDNYGLESGDMVVAYFLNNATTWRGEVARRIKLELKAHLEYYNSKRRSY